MPLSLRHTCVTPSGDSLQIFADSSKASEVCPVALRGILTSYINLCFVIGQLIANGMHNLVYENRICGADSPRCNRRHIDPKHPLGVSLLPISSAGSGMHTDHFRGTDIAGPLHRNGSGV